MRARSTSLRVATLLAGGLLLSIAEVANAQLPSVRISGAEPAVFEGDPTTAAQTLNFTVQLSSATNQDVTVSFSTFTFAGNAVGGSSCATANQVGGTDFISVTNQLVTIPANTTSVTTSVTVCRDDQVEFHPTFANQTREDIGVMLTNPVNAVCNGAECLNVGHIFDDDGTPFASINSVTAREPISGSRLATFTVTISHPHPGFEVRVAYATRNGTARAVAGACGTVSTAGSPDYLSRSGTLVFASGETTKTIDVPVCFDRLEEGAETFFVDLTPVLNATAVGSGTGTILNAIQPSLLGTFTLDPEGATVAAGEWTGYRFTWAVSEGVWRDLRAMELRVRQRDTGNVVLWIRWEESSNTFQLCEGPGVENAAPASVTCGPPAVAGTQTILTSRHASIDLSGTTVIGSGPTGPSVTLQLLVSFDGGAANRTYDVEVTAEGDNGIRDDFVIAGVLEVTRRQR